MTRGALSFIVCGVVALGVAGCSSDKKSSSTTSSTTTSSTPVSSAPPITSAPTTETPTSTADAATSSTTAGGSTTTVAGARVVTKPDDKVKLGDSGDGVTQIQNALVAAGYKVVVDGKFGPQTQQAVISFQKANGLQQDGVVGPQTWAKLSSAPTATTTKGATTTTAKGATTSTTIKA